MRTGQCVYSYLLKLLVLLHVLPGGVARALCLFLEGLVGGHERGLLGKKAGQTSQQTEIQRSMGGVDRHAYKVRDIYVHPINGALHFNHTGMKLHVGLKKNKNMFLIQIRSQERIKPMSIHNGQKG